MRRRPYRLAKPTGAICTLDGKYGFFLEKEEEHYLYARASDPCPCGCDKKPHRCRRHRTGRVRAMGLAA